MAEGTATRDPSEQSVAGPGDGTGAVPADAAVVVDEVRLLGRHAAPRRLKLVGRAAGSRRQRIRTRWFDLRGARRGALALMPLGALAAIVYGLLVLRQWQQPVDALWSYAYGAGAGLVVGAVLGGFVGALGMAVRTWRSAPVQTRPRSTWVRHRRGRPARAVRARVT